MTTPYSTPFFPAGPRPTPASTVSNKIQRPPIYNPYDKFSQNEFDSWIGGITGALRRALGEGLDDEEENPTLDQTSELFEAQIEEPEETPEVEESDSSEAEDSFAEIRSRRDKGKGRDPREGPGLGGRLQPIELQLSDSDEEEGEGEDEVNEEDEEDRDQYDDWKQYDSDGNRYDDEEEYEENEEPFDENQPSGHRQHSDAEEDVIELSSGEEEGSYEEDDADRSDSLDPNDQPTFEDANFARRSPPVEDEDGEVAMEDVDELIEESNERGFIGDRLGLYQPHDENLDHLGGDGEFIGEDDAQVAFTTGYSRRTSHPPPQQEKVVVFVEDDGQDTYMAGYFRPTSHPPPQQEEEVEEDDVVALEMVAEVAPDQREEDEDADGVVDEEYADDVDELQDEYATSTARLIRGPPEENEERHVISDLEGIEQVEMLEEEIIYTPPAVAFYQQPPNDNLINGIANEEEHTQTDYELGIENYPTSFTKCSSSS